MLDLTKEYEYNDAPKHKHSVAVVRNTFARVEYGNGDVYEGEFRDGFRHGTGTYHFSKTPGTRYEGQFVKDEFEGHGVYFYEGGTVYRGQWYASYKHGKGVFVNPAEKTEYDGDWCEGFRHGRGKMTSPDFTYHGEFEHDNINGSGSMVYTSTGISYDGEFQDNVRHGRGILNSENENYNGEWRDDKKNGQGVQKIKGVGVYTGGFVDDKRHGKGEVVYEEGRFKSYSGEWANDMKCVGERKAREDGLPVEKVSYLKNVLVRREV
ncbi:unnamed protein product [Amoebophrya sp. A25]|nr:unnamed protein product [Amoebophrya sp. A25]|eukprot:GSA25T00018530001.1